MTRPYAPLTDDHPLIIDGAKCPGCLQPFAVGDVITLVVIGPGQDTEAREQARQGQAYNARAIPAHYACVTGHES